MIIVEKNHYPLGRVFGMLTKQFLGVISERLKNIDLERYWYAIVLIAEQEEKITQKRLGELLNHDKASMVRIIDYLSKQGYVVRKQNSKDRREYFIELTQKAQKALPEIKSAIEEVNKTILKGINKSQLAVLNQCLNTIENNLHKMPATSVNLNYKKTKK